MVGAAVVLVEVVGGVLVEVVVEELVSPDFWENSFFLAYSFILENCFYFGKFTVFWKIHCFRENLIFS